ncbi:MAG: ABC transporter permease [Stellaceae bacterium]
MARRHGAWSRRLLAGIVGGVLFFLMSPLVIVFPLSLSAAAYLTFPPPGWSLQWFARYFASRSWIDATVLSIEVAFLTALLSLILGVPLAFVLARCRSRIAVALLDQLAALPLVVPSIITAVAIYRLFAPLHLIGAWYGLVLAHTVLALPFVVVVVTAALRDFDLGLEEAALGLGAGRGRAILHVTLPQIRTSLFTAAFFAFMASFDDLVLALFLAGSNMTLPKKTFESVMFEIDPTIAAVSVLQILFIVAVGVAALGFSGMAGRPTRLTRALRRLPAGFGR